MEQIISQEQSFQLKGGMYTLTTIQIISNDLELLELQLQDKIQQAPNFFKNAPIIIDFKLLNQQNCDIDISLLKKIFLKYQLILIGIKNSNEQQREVAINTNLAILRDCSSDFKNVNKTIQAVDNAKLAINQVAKAQINQEDDLSSITSNATKIVTEPVRSGQQILAPDGDLIILSKVGHGAEILAAGNIHVYGTLQGRALAGINGDLSARIFCNSLEAELVSISGNYLISEDIEAKAWQVPAMITVQQQKLHIAKMYN